MRAQKEISDQVSFLVRSMTPNRCLSGDSTDKTTALTFPNGDISTGLPVADPNLNQARIGKATWATFPAETPTQSEDHPDQQNHSVQNPSPIAIKQQCKPLCSCICHARCIIKSPWVLDSIIGKINVQYTGWRPPCNEFHCLRSPDSSFKMVYQLPKYIMSRYISVFMQYSALSGPEFLLRVPRIVSWSHLLWNYATNSDLLAIQKLFAEGKASPFDLNPQGSSALHYTGDRNNWRLHEFLLQQGVDTDHPNEVGRTPNDVLWEGSVAENFRSKGPFGTMLKESDYVQTRGFSTLHKILLGIICKDLESELALSTAEINVGDSKNMTPLCWATLRNDLQAVKTLLAFGAKPNIVDKWGRTPLHLAKSIDVCKILLDAGVNIHRPSKEYGRSALHHLLHNYRMSTIKSEVFGAVELLIDAGIDVDVRDSDGETPLLNTIFSGFTSYARRLLELGANPNVFNKSSHESSIHFAVSFDRHELIPLLLERGADYTAVNIKGRNIAHMAAWSASTKTISVLADSHLVNLDISLRCKEGKTPTDYLSERSVLTESEQGLHAEFERFRKSIPSSGVESAGGVPEADAVHELSDECDSLHLPGAYPDTDVSL